MISVLPQLYELDADPKRKEFLDDLFSFMQKRGEWGDVREGPPFTRSEKGETPGFSPQVGSSLQKPELWQHLSSGPSIVSLTSDLAPLLHPGIN